MSIDSVSLQLQSESMSVESLTAVVGLSATRSAARGDAVSSRNPSGPRHKVTTVLWSCPDSSDDLGHHVRQFSSTLEALTSHPQMGAFTVALCVMVTSRPLGYMVHLDSAEIRLLANASCGLMIDTYAHHDDDA